MFKTAKLSHGIGQTLANDDDDDDDMYRKFKLKSHLMIIKEPISIVNFSKSFISVVDISTTKEQQLVY